MREKNELLLIILQVKPQQLQPQPQEVPGVSSSNANLIPSLPIPSPAIQMLPNQLPQVNPYQLSSSQLLTQEPRVSKQLKFDFSFHTNYQLLLNIRFYKNAVEGKNISILIEPCIYYFVPSFRLLYNSTF